MRHLIRRIATAIDRPPFQVGDIVRFEPNERVLGWTQNLHGLYPGYVGEVTVLVRGTTPFEWDVYVDGKPLPFLSIYFRLVQRAAGKGE